MSGTSMINTLVIDTGAVIKNDPTVSMLRSRAEHLVTVPSIISEIRDAATRSRFETTLKPFLTVLSPDPASVKFVTNFARKTGDLAVLSKPDIELIALTYQLECKLNGGDWRLRRTPGQKELNGNPPPEHEATLDTEPPPTSNNAQSSVASQLEEADDNGSPQAAGAPVRRTSPNDATDGQDGPREPDAVFESSDQCGTPCLNGNSESPVYVAAEPQEGFMSDSDSDSDSWITPSNLTRKQAADAAGASKQVAELQPMQVAAVTSDYAMQNVILQINLNLLSPSMARVRQVRTHVLRCHACFQVCKDTSKQFCPRCGQPTLTRVSCSTNSHGEFKLHLKRNMQWNHRGDRYSIPKPVHGSANGKIKGAGKQGWGNELILAEDQKEYQIATREQKKQRDRNLMDEDYLPSILTGDRGKTGSRIRVGAGRSVNSKKR